MRLPNVCKLESYGALCHVDAEQDFFTNIVHLQVHLLTHNYNTYRLFLYFVADRKYNNFTFCLYLAFVSTEV